MKRIIILAGGQDNCPKIEKEGIPGVNELVKKGEIFLHGGSGSTATGDITNAMGKYLVNNSGKGMNIRIPKFMGTDKRLGNEWIFNKFSGNDKIIAKSETDGWYSAFEEYEPNFITEIQQLMLKTIQHVFGSIPNGATVVMVGHSPLIEWLALTLDPEGIPTNLQLEPLTGFVITSDAGQIKLAKTVGFTLPVLQPVD